MTRQAARRRFRFASCRPCSMAVCACSGSPVVLAIILAVPAVLTARGGGRTPCSRAVTAVGPAPARPPRQRLRIRPASVPVRRPGPAHSAVSAVAVVKSRGRDGGVSRSGWFHKQQPILATDGTTAAKPRESRLKGRRGAALTAGGAAMVFVAGVAIINFAPPGSHAAPVSAAQAAVAAQPGRRRPAPGTIGHARSRRERRRRRGPDPRAVLRAAGCGHPHAGALAAYRGQLAGRG